MFDSNVIDSLISKRGTPLRLTMALLLLSLIVLISGKFARAYFLRAEQILYYPRYPEKLEASDPDKDADLALFWDKEARDSVSLVDLGKLGYPKPQEQSRLMKYFEWVRLRPDWEKSLRVSNWQHLENFKKQFDAHQNKSESELLPNDDGSLNYADMPVPQLMTTAFLERIDDAPFMVLLVSFCFSMVFLSCLADALEFSNQSLSQAPPFGTKQWLWPIIIGLPIGFFFQKSHWWNRDFGPLHGTFWVEWFRPSIAVTQIADGVIYLLFTPPLVWVLILFARVVKRLLGNEALLKNPDYCQAICKLLRAPWWGLVFVSSYQITLVGLAKAGWRIRPPNLFQHAYTWLPWILLAALPMVLGAKWLPKNFKMTFPGDGKDPIYKIQPEPSHLNQENQP